MTLLLVALLAAGDRPNVLVIVSDDQRADTIGSPVVKTPNLDALAREGTTFRRAYCMGSLQGAVCVPSRAMFLTGRSLFRVDEKLKSEELWPQAMARAGYATFGTGKWHNGQPSYRRGFAAGPPVFFGGMGDQFKVKVVDASGPRLAEGYSTDLFFDAAEGFLRAHDGARPYFLYVSLTVPHDPRTPPPEYAAMYRDVPLPRNFKPEHPFDNGEMEVRDEKLLSRPRNPDDVRRELAAYYGMISHLDARVGRLMKAVDLTKTLVVFFSDHGLALGSHGLLGKQNLYEHSMRAPLILAGPGVPKGATSDAMGYLFDVFPTVAALAKVPLPEGVEGRNLLEGGRTSIFTAYRDVQRALRTERWKIIRYPKAGRTQVFDLAEDPDELNDLSGDEARVKELTVQLEAERNRWEK